MTYKRLTYKRPTYKRPNGRLLVWPLLAVLAGCNWFYARDNMNNGVREFKASNYAQAAEYFEKALEYDPEVPNGRLYLALSYSQQFTPDLDTPENAEIAERAVKTLEMLLEEDPESGTAIAALASLYQETGDLPRAREYYIKQTEVSPDDATAFYSVGSIDWWLLYDPPQGQTPEERMTLIGEGQEYLDKALELDPRSVDAMTMKNLIYRQDAMMIPDETEDPEEIAHRDDLLALADEWYERAIETRAENAERESQAGLGVE